VSDTIAISGKRNPRPPSPSPRFARVPSLSPRDDAGGEGF